MAVTGGFTERLLRYQFVSFLPSSLVALRSSIVLLRVVFLLLLFGTYVTRASQCNSKAAFYAAQVAHMSLTIIPFPPLPRPANESVFPVHFGSGRKLQGGSFLECGVSTYHFYLFNLLAPEFYI
jgi:hypothetical protein